MEVLLARIEALLRRTYGDEETETQPIQMGSITFNVAHQSLIINGEEKS